MLITSGLVDSKNSSLIIVIFNYSVIQTCLLMYYDINHLQ